MIQTNHTKKFKMDGGEGGPGFNPRKREFRRFLMEENDYAESLDQENVLVRLRVILLIWFVLSIIFCFL